MWRFKAPLSGRAGEIRSTDGPSRLNISVTLFPNCVVVPEAGTAVRAKQSGSELRAAQFTEYILIRRSHMASQSHQLRNAAISIVPEFYLAPCCLSTAKCFPSLSLFSVLSAEFKLWVSFLFLFPCSPVPPSLFPSQLMVFLSCTLCVLPTRPSPTLSSVYPGPAHLPGLDVIVIHPYPFAGHELQTGGWMFPCSGVLSDPPSSWHIPLLLGTLG